VNTVNNVGEAVMGYGLPNPPNPNSASIIGSSVSHIEE
jgi:hypothetical protein